MGVAELPEAEDSTGVRFFGGQDGETVDHVVVLFSTLGVAEELVSQAEFKANSENFWVGVSFFFQVVSQSFAVSEFLDGEYEFLDARKLELTRFVTLGDMLCSPRCWFGPLGGGPCRPEELHLLSINYIFVLGRLLSFMKRKRSWKEMRGSWVL